MRKISKALLMAAVALILFTSCGPDLSPVDPDRVFGHVEAIVNITAANPIIKNGYLYVDREAQYETFEDPIEAQPEAVENPFSANKATREYIYNHFVEYGLEDVHEQTIPQTTCFFQLDTVAIGRIKDRLDHDERYANDKKVILLEGLYDLMVQDPNRMYQSKSEFLAALESKIPSNILSGLLTGPAPIKRVIYQAAYKGNVLFYKLGIFFLGSSAVLMGTYNILWLHRP